MRKRRGFKACSMFFLACLLGLLICSGAHADVFMKLKAHKDATRMGGQSLPAKDTIQTIWMAANMMRHDEAGASMIIRLDEKKAYYLDNSAKSYVEMPLDFEKAMTDLEAATGKKDKEMEEQMKMAQSMFKMKMTITDTGEKKTINKWNCRKYIREMTMGMGPVKSEVWATEDLKMDLDLYAQFNAVMMAMQPGAKESIEQATAEMKKLKGVPVLTITTANVMGANMKSTEELLEFKEGKAPDGIFEIPAGYKKMSAQAAGDRRGRQSGGSRGNQ